ncbi:glycoside hydrolase superfamily [Chytriomyces sp. MP71]|nr:glycoside hydrolase superfamily [Chytriomyces sp. MP71]
MHALLIRWLALAVATAFVHAQSSEAAIVLIMQAVIHAKQQVPQFLAPELENKGAVLPQFVTDGAGGGDPAPAPQPQFVADSYPKSASSSVSSSAEAASSSPSVIPSSSAAPITSFAPVDPSPVTTAAAATSSLFLLASSSPSSPSPVSLSAAVVATTTSPSPSPIVVVSRATTTTAAAPSPVLPSYNSPRIVIYDNQIDNQISNQKYTHVIINFWTPSYDGWKVDPSALQVAGKKVLISAYGGGVNPTTDGHDPTKDAQKLAAFVKRNGFDGVDVDYEDEKALNGNGGEGWLITFTTELRTLLPRPYIITHAPQGPHFSLTQFPSGGYVKVDQAVGDLIDWYNVQFYNQGSTAYATCEDLLFHSKSEYTAKTSVFEINQFLGIPLEKLVIGKPVSSDGAGDGYMDPETLAGCLSQAVAKGWNAGAMGWRYGLDYEGRWAATLATSLGM